jgi:hypothetical protein
MKRKMMSNVVDIRTWKGTDPILRKGDLVIVRDTDDEHILGLGGIVTEVLQRYSEDSEAPGQAATIVIAIPAEEDEWSRFVLPLASVNRRLGLEADALRGYEIDEGCV